MALQGLGGMAGLISAGDQRMIVSFGPRAMDDPAAAETLQGFNDVYKARIEWRFVHQAGGSKPFAAVVRWSTSLLDEFNSPGPKTINGEILVVTRLGSGGVCHLCYVDALAKRDAASAGANDGICGNHEYGVAPRLVTVAS